MQVQPARSNIDEPAGCWKLSEIAAGTKRLICHCRPDQAQHDGNKNQYINRQSATRSSPGSMGRVRGSKPSVAAPPTKAIARTYDVSLKLSAACVLGRVF